VAIFHRLEEHPRLHPVIIDGRHAMWIRPEGSRSTMAGFDLDQFDVNPDAYNESVDASYVSELRRRLIQRLPALSAAPMRGGWSGVITSSPDGHAIIDQVPSISGLFVILGDSGTNFKTAPAIGACIAEWIMAGEPATADIRPFRSTRFAEGTPIRGQHEYGGDQVSVFR
jgi:sarcosine oxidase subunit beta